MFVNTPTYLVTQDPRCDGQWVLDRYKVTDTVKLLIIDEPYKAWYGDMVVNEYGPVSDVYRCVDCFEIDASDPKTYMYVDKDLTYTNTGVKMNFAGTEHAGHNVVYEYTFEMVVLYCRYANIEEGTL